MLPTYVSTSTCATSHTPPALIVSAACLTLGALLTSCGGAPDTEGASSTSGQATSTATGSGQEASGGAPDDGNLAPKIQMGAPVPRRDRPRPQAIPEADWEAIKELPPSRSGSDAVLFPPGDNNLMEPIVGTKEFSDEAIEINPYELMPRDLNITDAHRAEIYELLVELQPLRLDLTSDHHDRQFILNKRRVEALEQDDRPEVGWAALHAFTNYKGEDFQSRRTLLRIGARVSPDAASAILKTLAFEYGHRMGDRAESLLLLAETDPEALLEGARPYLERTGRRFQTAPSDEFFARAWVKACKNTDKSPVPMMADVAMNIALEPIARYVAIDALGEHGNDPLAQATLQEAIVESTGDGYFRRKAAQAIIASFPGERACVLLAEVLSNEADVNMARFLDDMIQTNCR